MAGGDVRTVRIRVEGRVQGVGYRYWTERVAGELGLSGWVRNRRDGSVEGLLSGAPDKVGEMLARCRNGPPSAAVSLVDVAEEAKAPLPGFRTLPTG
jgi:acylphosphatase